MAIASLPIAVGHFWSSWDGSGLVFDNLACSELNHRQIIHLMKVTRVLLCMAVIGLSGASGRSLRCDVGPITRTFGSAPWLLYSCSDGKSLVVVSAPGSPAAPFHLFFSPQGNGYYLHGEGTGAKSVTDAALKELQTLRPGDIAVLIRETKEIKKQ